MKKLLILMLALTMGVSVVSAQQQKKAKATVETVKFATDLDCENCAKKILNVIPFKKGVKDCVVDVPAKTVEITFDTRKTNAEKLAAELEKIDVHIVECNTQAGPCVGEHTKQDACCGGHDHSGHNHAH
jgi:copper chaperone CopZ